MSSLNHNQKLLAQDICWYGVKYHTGIKDWHILENAYAYIEFIDGTQLEFAVVDDVVLATEMTGVDADGNRQYDSWAICRFGEKNYRRKGA